MGNDEERSERLRVLYPASAMAAAFADRRAAGELLGEHLVGNRGFDTLVIGLPRGGMEVAEALALGLGADLDVLLARKIRTPGAPELAAGAVAEDGTVVWNEDVITAVDLRDADWLGERDRARRELEARVSVYRTILPRAQVRGRTVLLTDDGVATGATVRAAVATLVPLAPGALIVALPGGDLAALAEIASADGVDEVVALAAPEPFVAVGQLYHTFPQVSDAEVMRILRHACDRRSLHALRRQGAGIVR